MVKITWGAPARIARELVVQPQLLGLGERHGLPVRADCLVVGLLETRIHGRHAAVGTAALLTSGSETPRFGALDV